MITTFAASTRRLSMRSVRIGPLIEETYTAFRNWDRQAGNKANLSRLKAENPIGAGSAAWLTVVAKTLAARFQDEGEMMPLVILAQSGMPIDQWRECLLWHVGQRDVLFHDFLCDWLYPAYRAGSVRIRSEDVVPFVSERTAGRIGGGRDLTEVNRVKAAQDLLRMASRFGLLKGRNVREFRHYRLSDESFLYVLYALSMHELNPRCAIESREWRMFLMGPEDVENELLRLHQFRRLHYEAAGSLVSLRLPYASLQAYAESRVR